MQSKHLLLLIIISSIISSCTIFQKSDTDIPPEPPQDEVNADPVIVESPVVRDVVVMSADASTIAIENIIYHESKMINGNEKLIKHEVLGTKTMRMEGQTKFMDVIIPSTEQSFTCQERIIRGISFMVWIGGDSPHRPR